MADAPRRRPSALNPSRGSNLVPAFGGAKRQSRHLISKLQPQPRIRSSHLLLLLAKLVVRYIHYVQHSEIKDSVSKGHAIKKAKNSIRSKSQPLSLFGTPVQYRALRQGTPTGSTLRILLDRSKRVTWRAGNRTRCERCCSPSRDASLRRCCIAAATPLRRCAPQRSKLDNFTNTHPTLSLTHTLTHNRWATATSCSRSRTTSTWAPTTPPSRRRRTSRA